MTSAYTAWIMGLARNRWFRTALRRRLSDGEREKWMDRFVARAVSLSAFWARAGGQKRSAT